MMKKWIIALAVIGCFSACIPSVHPIYEAKNLVNQKDLPGIWKDQHHPKNVWHFSQTGKGAYQLIYDEGGQKNTFDVHLIQLGGQYYLDFYPHLSTTAQEENFLYESTMIPMHLFAKLDITSTTSKIYLFDQEWLEKQILDRRIKIRHEKLKDRVLLTASTKDLQQFVLKYQNDEKIFSDVLVLKK